MLSSVALRDKFGTLHEWEKWHLEWTRVCAKINPTEKNADRLKVSEIRAKLLGVEV